jgi:hypothetical protein
MTTKTNKVPDDKVTNDALLCMVFPEYAIKFCKTVAITEIDYNHASAPVLLSVLDWYAKNYSRAGEWFTDNLRAPTAVEITKGMTPSEMSHADDLIAFKGSQECLERFIANANTVTFA